MIGLVLTVLTIVGQWKYFEKMGRQGWEGIVPIYNAYVLFEELYGNGWRMLLMLIPLYNIYLAFKVNIDLAHAFGLGAGFGIGLTLLNPIFTCILGFGNAAYYNNPDFY